MIWCLGRTTIHEFARAQITVHFDRVPIVLADCLMQVWHPGERFILGGVEAHVFSPLEHSGLECAIQALHQALALGVAR